MLRSPTAPPSESIFGGSFPFFSSTTLPASDAGDEADPNGLAPGAPGAKLDQGKNRVWLMLEGFLPAFDHIFRHNRLQANEVLSALEVLGYAPRALEEIARVTTAGAAKYMPNGWKQVEDGEARYLDAAARHALEMTKGHILDDGPGGTGCLHEAQVLWNLLAALTLSLTRIGTPLTAAQQSALSEAIDVRLMKLEAVLSGQDAEG
jgi:hypothetical protein